MYGIWVLKDRGGKKTDDEIVPYRFLYLNF